ncbi:MAG: carotenoid oxygenase family protein [Ilumatobacter sp.]
MASDRRTFITSALGAAVLAGCGSDNDSASAPSTSTDASSATVAPTTTATTTTTTVPAATTTTSHVPTMSPEPLPTNDRWWLDQNFGPVAGDLESTDLVVNGRLPNALSGTWVRNGPNPAGESPHWFLGNAMVHGLRLSEGRAEWYRRREIATPFAPGGRGGAVPGGEVTYSNVSSVVHGGRLLSLGEVGLPYELNVNDLSTIGAYDFDGALTTSMTAHPKIDPQTGEMFFFGYGFRDPYLTYLVADSTGQLQRVIPIALPAPSMVHDFAITDRSALFLDLAVVFAADEPGLPYRFDRSHQCRLGVLDRDAVSDTTRWFDIEPCFVFHTINAHQTGSVITYDVIRYEELWTQRSTETFPPAVPYRYSIDLDAGTVVEGPLDDRPSEFPMIDQRVVGSVNTKAWGLELGGDLSAPTTSTLLQFDADGASSSAASFAFDAADIAGEPLFVADPDRPDEGSGWLLLVVFRATTNTSDVVVIDAQDIASGPIATVVLPERVPFGFHASWSPLA